MHRLRSRTAIFRLRITALLTCAKCLLLPLGISLLIYSIVQQDDKLTLNSLGIIVLSAVAAVFQWILAARTSCPLCMTPVLAHKGCTKHRNSKSFLGSYRLRVALAILFTNSFRCPYCAEPTVLEVRQKHRS